MMEIKAFIFDLNGTMIDDMPYHAKAWYDILNNDLKAGLTMDEVKVQMYGKNEEVLERFFGKGHFSSPQMKELSVEKERRYQHAFKPHLKLIKGLEQFLDKTKNAGIAMGIGSAAITWNIDFVLDNLNIRNYFRTIVSADDVTSSKPDPETFIRCATLLGVSPKSCLVFEDAPKGVEAALNAGMASVVLTTMHHKDEFKKYEKIIGYLDDYSHANPIDFINATVRNLK
jgi:beta-phosphoglucomutase family hydrolase